MAHLSTRSLDPKIIIRCRELAERISRPVEAMIEAHTTVSIERATLRLLGIEGALQQAGGQRLPEVNVIVEDLRKEGVLDRGVLHWFVNGMIQKKMTPSELSNEVASR